MQITGTYFIGYIEIYCDCGHEECIQIDECGFDCGNECNSVFECPNCGKKAEFDLYVDDSVTKDIDCYVDEEDEDFDEEDEDFDEEDEEVGEDE